MISERTRRLILALILSEANKEPTPSPPGRLPRILHFVSHTNAIEGTFKQKHTWNRVSNTAPAYPHLSSERCRVLVYPPESHHHRPRITLFDETFSFLEPDCYDCGMHPLTALKMDRRPALLAFSPVRTLKHTHVSRKRRDRVNDF